MTRFARYGRGVIAALTLLCGAVVAGCGGGGGGGGPTPVGTATPTLAPNASPTPKASATPTSMATATATPTPTLGPTGVPSPYATLAAAVSSKASSFAASVAAACPATTKTSKLFVSLLPANSGHIYSVLQGAGSATIATAAQSAISLASSLKNATGIQGVTIQINYPTLVDNAANLPNSSITTANYGAYLSYYQQVVTGLRGLGLGVDIETNVLSPTGTQSPAPVFNYNGLTVAQLESGQAENAQHVIDNLKPDHLSIGTEPATLGANSGLTTQIDTQPAYAAYIAAVFGKLSKTNSPNTLIGAGSDDWQSGTYLSSLPTNLDFYDDHLYPPDELGSAIAQLQQLHATGKPIVISETWLDKEDVSIDGTTGPIMADTVFARDAFSFWGNTDASYITSMMQLANCTNVSDVAFFYSDQLFGYVPYAAFPNLTYYQANNELATYAAAGIQANTITPAGVAVQTYTGAGNGVAASARGKTR